MVNLNPKAFQETPLADLCLEDALKVGSSKSEKLKPTDFKETSIRFCINGLNHWLRTYVDDYCDRPIFYIVRDLSWHWASFCESNETLVKVRKDYTNLRRDIVETSSYVDLVDRLQHGDRFKEFGYSGRPFNVLLPLETTGIVARTGEALGVPFSRFSQIGLAWSLSTNSKGLYESWMRDIFKPLFDEMMAVANRRQTVIDEVRNDYEFRLCAQLRREGDR